MFKIPMTSGRCKASNLARALAFVLEAAPDAPEREGEAAIMALMFAVAPPLSSETAPVM
jgi:hypothetical protein